ncbi:MAG: hypothetical protein DWQ06_17005 [Calditrichaeota bacterium]|nr:MAG: hypothetical protein DWQ06_17005 [Calditrichota bacterium]
METEGKITKIEVQKKTDQRYSVFLNNEFAFGVSEKTFFEFRIKEGDFLKEAKIEEILLCEELQKARGKAFGLVARKFFSELEIRKKLQKFREEVVDDVVGELKTLNYLDDKELAKRMIHDLSILRGVGKIKIRYELRRKGIKELVFEDLLDEMIEEKSQFEAAKKLLLKKLQTIKEVNYQSKGKIWRFLQSKGFENDVISEVFEKHFG